MKKMIIIFLAVLFALAAAQNKQRLDLNFSNTEKDPAFAKTTGYTAQQISNNWISATMIDGGYYTLGTVNGLDASTLDDNCPLTYGHPYAMTSYPIFSIDSSWYTMDSFFPGKSSSIMHSTSDSLNLILIIDNLIEMQFSISIEGERYELSLQSTNLDTVSHHIGLGFVYDPTLGSGGDGSLFVDDQLITDETLFQNRLSTLDIWERSQTARGLGNRISFTDSARVIATNWMKIHETDDPLLTETTGLRLYDLALKMYWPEQRLNAAETYKTSMDVSLLETDFSSEVFMRWDIPQFLP